MRGFESQWFNVNWIDWEKRTIGSRINFNRCKHIFLNMCHFPNFDLMFNVAADSFEVLYTNVPKVEDDRICPICGDRAPDGEAHHPHYGGICCFSCRAFFRRANQKTKSPDLQCQFGKCHQFQYFCLITS